MGRTATKSFETLAAFLKDFAAKPLTTTQIVDGLALCPSLPKLSQPTVNRCLNSDAAPFYGIVLAKVPGTSRNHYTYDASVAKRASELVVSKTSKEYLDNMLLTVDLETKAKRALEVINSNGVDKIAELDEAIATKSEWFVTDEAEQFVLTRFRTLRLAFNNEETIAKAVSFYTEPGKVFDASMIEQLIANLQMEKPLINKQVSTFFATTALSPSDD